MLQIVTLTLEIIVGQHHLLPKVSLPAIGGGASGYRDCDGDDEGGGGGGGAYAESTRNFSAGQTLSIKVGSGGSSPSCDDGNDGSTTEIKGGPGKL